jgi:hypothetical protein
MTTRITVTSHVARDFLQNAAYFSTVPKVVWEYVSNAIDNPGEGEAVHVEVQITRERIVIRDNAAGMTRDDLNRFFTMHGENTQRAQGKKVRGQFGTGKCAAFGIASRLRVETVRAGRLNVVELDRADITASKGGVIPVRDVTVDASTRAMTGTTILISALQTKQLEIPGTIRYIERHLGRQHQIHSVTVNDHLCELEEPITSAVRQFAAPPEVAARLGAITATIRVSPTPLDPETAGIDVFSYGNWHDTTLAGLPINEFTRRLFGEVDVPMLEEYEGPFPPFDNTRNNTLSPQNPLVATLFGWLGTCLRAMLTELEADEAERRRSVDAKALRAEASRIERVLNDDFRSLQIALERGRKIPALVPDQEELVEIQGRDETSPFVTTDDAGNVPMMSGGATSLMDSDSPYVPMAYADEGGVPATPPTDLTVGPGESGAPPSEGVGGDEAGALPDPHALVGTGAERASQREIALRPKRLSGFHMDFRNETESAPRSRYEETTKTIIINLDHPQLKAARRLGPQASAAFRQISYELAFVEYALALGNEHLRRDPLVSGEDALYEIRETINRVTRRIGNIL